MMEAVCVYICMHTWTCVCMYVCMSVFMYVCIYEHVCVCVSDITALSPLLFPFLFGWFKLCRFSIFSDILLFLLYYIQIQHVLVVHFVYILFLCILPYCLLLLRFCQNFFSIFIISNCVLFALKGMIERPTTGECVRRLSVTELNTFMQNPHLKQVYCNGSELQRFKELSMQDCIASKDMMPRRKYARRR